METLQLGVVEEHFANLVWLHAPISTKDLVALCEKELNWKRTTTYTVLKKLCLRGLFQMNNAQVTVLMSKDAFNAIRSQQFVESKFAGSLPAFIAAFTTQQNLSEEDISQIRQLIDAMESQP